MKILTFTDDFKRMEYDKELKDAEHEKESTSVYSFTKNSEGECFTSRNNFNHKSSNSDRKPSFSNQDFASDFDFSGTFFNSNREVSLLKILIYKVCILVAKTNNNSTI